MEVARSLEATEADEILLAQKDECYIPGVMSYDEATAYMCMKMKLACVLVDEHK